MRIRIIIIDDDGVVARNDSPAFDAGNDGGLPADGCFFFDAADELGADDAFVYKGIAPFELAPAIPLRHACRGTGTTGRAVDGLVAIEHRVAGSGSSIECGAGPHQVAATFDMFVLGMLKAVSFVDAVAAHAAPRNQLVRLVVLDAAKVLLRVYDGVEITAVSHIKTDGAEVGAFYLEVGSSEVGLYIGELYRLHLFAFLLVFDQNQSGRCFHAQLAGYLWRHQSFFNGDGDGTDGTMPAHGQAAAGFDKEHADIVLWVGRWVEDAAAHHVVAAGLKHQPLADPVVLGKEVQAPFHHGGTLQQRATACHQPYRVAAGMGIDAKEFLGGHGEGGIW